MNSLLHNKDLDYRNQYAIENYCGKMFSIFYIWLYFLRSCKFKIHYFYLKIIESELESL